MSSLKSAIEQLSATDQVEIADLSGDLNAFEMVGPRTSQVIHGAFKLADNGQEARKVRTIPSLHKTELNIMVLVLASPSQCPISRKFLAWDGYRTDCTRPQIAVSFDFLFGLK